MTAPCVVNSAEITNYLQTSIFTCTVTRPNCTTVLPHTITILDKHIVHIAWPY